MPLSILKEPEFLGIVIGLLFGIIAKIMLLRTDYRQYPTYPHGKVIHMSLGVIAAGLGALVVPALLSKEYTAVTFLTLAAQQFRDVRRMERETLTEIDDLELVPRGNAYIEGIAMVFEGRNYLVIFSALIASLFTVLFVWYWGVVAGILSLLVAKMFQKGKSIEHIADVHIADVKIEDPDLFVESIYIMNVGLREDIEIIKENGVGLVLTPKNDNSKVTLSGLGQRQALLHNLSTLLGVYRDSGEPTLIPMAKLDLESGKLAIFILPREKDPQKILRAVKGAPIVENSVRMPTEAYKGGKA
ncbi:YIEGIA family protein [Virgibacillus alimentarius]|uniref:Membrane protein YeaQ/YmgE (Transglycosylase-associated protein family) n=1 Tax=Virgibacillus alimentarius TaxID=698769 RepID=A0ABS4S6X9_9BACI|nr:MULTISPECIES: YIEGIA family protein [Virgibacillus]MBP2257265.1 putative membrane protein YeaQ/YmgE (transglycosylase-associated protein family) [Virgibacillus alimentarius]HLR67353.1 YIEGIA family protein [Virgibacillus sp.]